MTIAVTLGDCVEVLRQREGPLFDSCVCDPPYELGFMGRAWDASGVAFRVETWRAIYDALKPGAYLVAFSGTRTYHRMVVAIEDAGFEIRDQLAWAYGSGFPKSLDVSKAIDKAAGARGHDSQGFNAAGGIDRTNGGSVFRSDHPDYVKPAGITAEARQWEGWGTALKPAWEPIVLARKPLSEKTVAANVLAHGTGGLNIDACRIDAPDGVPLFSKEETRPGTSFDVGSNRTGQTSNAGRFPANLIHDGSEEVEALFPASSSGNVPHNRGAGGIGNDGHKGMTTSNGGALGGESPARFFYSAKAGPLDRLGTDHPTVKPVDVMRWLSRLVTRPGGLILDPFAGSGTTGIAALAEGFDCELIDIEAAHVEDIERKLASLRGEGARIMEKHIKRKAARSTRAPSPLFGDEA